MMRGSTYNSISSRYAIILLVLSLLVGNRLFWSDAFTVITPLFPTTISRGRTRSSHILSSSSSTTTTLRNDQRSRRSAVETTNNNSNDNDKGEEQRVRLSPDSEPLRWGSKLNPKVRARIVKAGQARAIANKKKRESAQDKKRRVLMFYKKKVQEKKKASWVKRPLPLGSGADGTEGGGNVRTPLAALIPGMQVTGIVISLTPFGAYVDVGTECDGLLHVSQLSRTQFIDHPRQLLTPGQEITVRIRSFSPERKKLHLTLLDDVLVEEDVQNDGDDTIVEEGILVEDVQVDDELWGELTRVTNYGAYVNVGAVVVGFLHFMDTPESTWPEHTGQHPSTYMRVGDRVRVWVANVDLERQRIKLTANRPPHLPGPRREI